MLSNLGQFSLETKQYVHLFISLALVGGGGRWVGLPVPLPLVDEPVVDLLQLQSCLLHQSSLVIFLQKLGITYLVSDINP